MLYNYSAIALSLGTAKIPWNKKGETDDERAQKKRNKLRDAEGRGKKGNGWPAKRGDTISYSPDWVPARGQTPHRAFLNACVKRPFRNGFISLGARRKLVYTSLRREQTISRPRVQYIRVDCDCGRPHRAWIKGRRELYYICSWFTRRRSENIDTRAGRIAYSTPVAVLRLFIERGGPQTRGSINTSQN